jgi:hypothetical protein
MESGNNKWGRVIFFFLNNECELLSSCEYVITNRKMLTSVLGALVKDIQYSKILHWNLCN